MLRQGLERERPTETPSRYTLCDHATTHVVLITGTGVQWSNINQPVSVDDNFTMLYTFLLLTLDTIIYSLITWYFDAVLPGAFGTPLPFYFPFTVKRQGHLLTD